MTTTNLTLKVIPAETGGLVGYIEEVPGVATQAETKEELITNIKDALIVMIEAMAQEKAGGNWTFDNAQAENLEIAI